MKSTVAFISGTCASILAFFPLSSYFSLGGMPGIHHTPPQIADAPLCDTEASTDTFYIGCGGFF